MELDCINWASVEGEVLHQFACSQIPEFQNSVLPSRGNPAAIWTEPNTIDTLCVALKTEDRHGTITHKTENI